MSTVGHTMQLGGTMSARDEHDPQPPAIVDPHGKPLRAAIGPLRCPRCNVDCPKGDPTKRTRSGGFGGDVHDVCVACGYEWIGELTV